MNTQGSLANRHLLPKTVASLFALVFIVWNIQILNSLREKQDSLEENASLTAQVSQLNGAIFVLEKVIELPVARKYPIARDAIWATYYSEYLQRLNTIQIDDPMLAIVKADIDEMKDMVGHASIVNSKILDSMRHGHEITTEPTTLNAYLDEAIYGGMRASRILQGYQENNSLQLTELWRWFIVMICIWCALAVALVALVGRLQNSRMKRLRIEEALRSSEQNLQTLFDHSLHGFVLLSLDGRVQAFNAMAVEITTIFTGKSLKIGGMVDWLLTAADGERFNTHFQQALKGQFCSSEAQVGDVFTGQRWYEIEYNPVLDETGQVSAICITTLEITERKQTQEVLRRSEERFSTLVRQSSDMITLLDARGFITYQSPASERILGYREEELLGSSAFELIVKEDLDQVMLTFEEALSTQGEEIVMEFRARRKDGSIIYLECVGQNLLADPDVRGIVINSRDLTRRKQMELQLVAAKEKAEEMNRMKTTFLANMSHEIRTPMTAILGFASVLRENITYDDRIEYADTIERSGRRLLDTINSILDLAKVEANQLQLTPSDLYVHAEVQGIITMLTPIAISKGLNLVLKPYSSELLCNTDPKYLGQILTNFIGNAIKFTERGEIAVTIRFDRPKGIGQAHIEVRDQGIGISPKFLPHVFDEFKQESSGWGRQYEGSGLGLTISKRLADLMGAEISVSSEVGQGSVFTLRLAAELSQTPVPTSRPRQKLYSRPAQKPSVLLVEDNDDNVGLVRHYLKGYCELTIVHDGQTAYEVATNQYFDLALMDINLGSGINGLEVTSMLRKHPLTVDMPIIAITAYAMKSDENSAIEAGCSSYMSKPFTREELLGQINRYLEVSDLLHSRN